MKKKKNNQFVLTPIPGGNYDLYRREKEAIKNKLPKDSDVFLYNMVGTYGTDTVANMDEIDIGNYVYNKGILHALNMNVGRNIPWIEDGLKSVERRVLFTMNRLKLYGNTNKKVSSITGDMMSTVYPHGDAAATETIYRLGRSYSTMIPYIRPVGHFGNMNDMRGAAPRYAAAALTPYAVDCFFSEEGPKHPIYDVKDSYEYSMKEPVYLTSRYPNILMQWNLGIGKGAASRLGAFNSIDVFNTAIAMLDNPNVPVDIYPDTPTPITIVNKSQLKGCFDRSEFKVHMRAPYEFVMDKRRNSMGKIEDKYTVVFTALPLNIIGNIVKNEIIAVKEADQKRSNKKLPEVLNVETEVSDDTLGGIRFIVEYEHGYDPDVLVDKLYKSTSLGKVIGVKYKLITDNQPGTYTPREILQRWIIQRYDQKRRYYHQKALHCAKERAKYEAICVILNKNNIDNAIAIIKSAKTADDAAIALSHEFGFTDFQSRMVLAVTLSNLSKMNIADTENKRDEAIKNYKYYRKLLTSEEAIKEIIRSDLEEGLKKYGKKRVAKLTNLKSTSTEDSNKEKVIVYNTDCYYCLDSVDDLPKIEALIDKTYKMTRFQNKDTVIIFNKKGLAKVLNGYAFNSNKQTVNNALLGLDDIVSIVSVPDDSILDMLFITRLGYGKRMEFQECEKLSKGKVINLGPGDELASVILVDSQNANNLVGMISGDHMYYVTIDRFPMLKKSSSGNRMIKSKKETIDITNAVFFDMSDTQYLLLYGESGYIKVLDAAYLGFTNKDDKIVLQDKNIFGVIALPDKHYKLRLYDANGKSDITCDIDKNITFNTEDGNEHKFKMSTTISSPIKVFKKTKNEFYHLK